MNKISQPRTHSVLESLANVAIGYGIALLSQIIVFPLFGIHIGIKENIGIGAVFTVISIVRSYVLRRLFNLWHVRRMHG